jgi:hypothetical protein
MSTGSELPNVKRERLFRVTVGRYGERVLPRIINQRDDIGNGTQRPGGQC